MQVSPLDLTQLYYKLKRIILQFTCWSKTYMCQTVFRIHGHKTEMPVFSEIDLQLEKQCFSVSTQNGWHRQRKCGQNRLSTWEYENLYTSPKVDTCMCFPVYLKFPHAFVWWSSFQTFISVTQPYRHMNSYNICSRCKFSFSNL
jgi:hypothetical protein